MMFDYFRAGEEEQFAYFRIPWLLITGEAFQELSTESKVLYGVLLDRTSLSRKHGWYDDSNRVYVVYTVQSAMCDLKWCKKKICGLFKELEEYGLIERERRPHGLPALIYVKKFYDNTIDNQIETSGALSTPHKTSGALSTPREVQNRHDEVSKVNHIQPNYNHTNLSNPNNNIYNNNIHRNTPPIIPPHGANEEVPEMEIDKYDAMIPDDIQGCVRRELRDWLEYKHEKKQDYKELGFTQMLTKIRKGIKEFGEECVAESISDAMSNNYAGFFIKKRATKNYGDSGYPSPDDITRMALELQEGYDSELGRNRNANL